MVNNCVYSTARTIGVFGAVLLALAACSRKGNEPDVGEGSIDTIFTAQELSNYAYYRGWYPAGFYVDDVGELYPRFVKRQCTDDRDQALAWSNEVDSVSATHGDVLAERETEKFFEFTREWPVVSPYAIIDRVYKCSYLDPSGSGFDGETYVYGVLNVRPISSSVVKELCEFLYASGRVSGINVFASVTVDRDTHFEHGIFTPRIVFGDYCMYDEVTLWKYEFSIDKTSGLVLLRKIPKMTINGRLNECPDSP